MIDAQLLAAAGAAAVGLVPTALLLRERARHRAFHTGAEAALGLPGTPRDALIAHIVALAAPSDRDNQIHSLTGLPTREPLVARMRQDAAGTLAVIACSDFDRLCAFDAALGAELLRTLAARLQAMVAASRFVAHVDRSHLALWIAGEGDAAPELDALGYALGDAIHLRDRAIQPGIAIRATPWSAAAGTPEAALTRTIAAFAAPPPPAGATPIDLEAIARERYQLEQDLRLAVGRGELRLHLQPLIDAADARVIGAEALIRWHHPQRGIVSPARFVPVMETAGLSHEIGLWTLNTAVRAARSWRLGGLGALRVAVNVSGHQLESDELPRLVERTLARHSLGADALEIELTETVAMNDAPGAQALFAQLHALGVTIAIDDFGTGYSSLSTLRTLAFDKIKIDREFVTDVHARRDSQAICLSILALGRGLGIRVLAEGVETRAEYEWLRRHGCQHFQGFYFSPPLEEAAFLAFAGDRATLARLVAMGVPTVERLRA